MPSERNQEEATFWGYGPGLKTPKTPKTTTTRPMTTKSRTSEKKQLFNYNRRVTKLAANKLKELLETEKEIKYAETAQYQQNFV